ncbi:cutinase family protein (plasmid) [Tomitella fengzijianii]|uniref:Cutinase family protein n=1 Tax=Tomitella fengzijianii TaxID=2597660 RepID=A0A516X8Z1_9ACTN|nr:cutinase family protein [Tomitella fengzijianii]QDQ99528.1 cutinase family protein [Tomitella fengzijianii]
MKRVAVRAAAAAVASAAVAATLPATTATAAVASGGCDGFMAVLVPGTGETSEHADPAVPAGLLGQVGTALEDAYGASIAVVYPPYPAAAFNGMLYSQSVDQGIADVTNLMRRCPDAQYVLAGYSQGAQIANDVAVAIGHGDGPVAAAQIEAVGLLANPRRGTDGAKIIGPPLAGQGIAGPNPRGFGALSGHVFDICHPDDKYCNIAAAKNSFLSSLGRVLGNDPAPDTGPAAGGKAGDTSARTSPAQPARVMSQTGGGTGMAAELGADYGGAHLAAAVRAAERLPARVEQLGENPQAPVGWSRRSAVASQAAMIADTLTPVGQTQAWLSTNPAAQDKIAAADGGTPLSAAGDLLAGLADVDVASLAATAGQIADVLGSTPGAGGGVSAAADTLAEGLSGIAGMDTSMLTAAGTALRTVQPVTLLDQALQMVADVTSVDYLGVAGDFGLLGGQLLAGDIPAAHATAGRINNNLSPLVEAASKLPLEQVAQVLALIPDPVSQAVALVCRLLDNVDVIGLAKAVGQLQEVAWQVVETGNPLALGQLLPIGLNIAHIALGVFTGGQETPASALHSGPTALTAQMGQQAAASDLVGLGQSVAAAATSDGAADLAQLVDAGFTAATFYGSQVHQKYTTWSPRGDGTPATAVMAGKFRDAIGG